MTDEQKELLKAMHLIKDYCEKHGCENCCLARKNDLNYCPFDQAPCSNWDLKPLEENEENFSVFS